MKSYLLPLAIYLLVINCLGFLMVWADKRKARRNRWRIAEKRFFQLALLGGALGVYLGMRAFRHKTQHRLFTLGIPTLALLNVAALGYLFLIQF